MWAHILLRNGWAFLMSLTLYMSIFNNKKKYPWTTLAKNLKIRYYVHLKNPILSLIIPIYIHTCIVNSIKKRVISFLQKRKRGKEDLLLLDYHDSSLFYCVTHLRICSYLLAAAVFCGKPWHFFITSVLHDTTHNLTSTCWIGFAFKNWVELGIT